MKLKTYGLAIVFAMSLGLTGCGGGSGGGSGGDSSSISFPSNAVVAEPTIENGKKVKDATAKDQSEGVPYLNSVKDNSNVNVVLLSNKVSKKIFSYAKDASIQTYSLNEVINETESCSNGGSISFNGNATENVGGSITITANNCNDGYDLVNGSIYVSVDNYDSAIDEYKHIYIKFTSDFTVKDLSTQETAKIIKNSYIDANAESFDVYGDLKTFNATITLLATDGIENVGLKDCKFYFEKINSYKTKWYMTQGRVYIDNLEKYVDYDTNYNMSNTPFIINKWTNEVESGTAYFNMANNGKVKITAENGEAKAYVDSDGDGVYELSE